MTQSTDNYHNQNQSTGAVDLSHFDEAYSNAEVEKRDFDEVPDGKYQVFVNKVALKKAKESGNPYLRWELKILGPTQKGRMLWRNNAIVSIANIKWLKTDLCTCGLELEKLSDLQLHLDKLLDVKLEVTKRTREGNSDVFINKRIVTDDVDSDDSPVDAPSQSWEQF